MSVQENLSEIPWYTDKHLICFNEFNLRDIGGLSLHFNIIHQMNMTEIGEHDRKLHTNKQLPSWLKMKTCTSQTMVT